MLHYGFCAWPALEADKYSLRTRLTGELGLTASGCTVSVRWSTPLTFGRVSGFGCGSMRPVIWYVQQAS